MTAARIVPIVLIVAVLAGCNLARITAPAPTAYPSPQPLAPSVDGQAALASITPLAANGAASQTVYITATPVPGAAAQTVYVTATPFGSGGISIAIVPETPNPNLTPPPTSTNVIEAIINNVVIPAWNFLYTLALNGIGSLWAFAGARGGLFAQALCCLIPAALLSIIVVRLALSRGRRWLF